MKPDTYDAVIILGSGIRKTDDGYQPTTYQSHDQFGMLAGGMNILAAVALYEQGRTARFVFTSGVSEKTKAVFGVNVPTEAEVYKRDFLCQISGEPPEIILETKSVNTSSNLTEAASIINQYGWQRVAIVAARYHHLRVPALWQLTKKTIPVNSEVTFLVSEDIVVQAYPGVYDAEIAAAYDSPEGKKRLENEAAGLRRINNGEYVLSEAQLIGG